MVRVRARNDGGQGKRCGLAGQSGPKSFAAAILNILSENVLLCCVYWQSCGSSAGIQKQATFLHVSRPQPRGHFRGEFCEVATFHSTHIRSQTKTACEKPSLFSMRNKISQRRFLRKV